MIDPKDKDQRHPFPLTPRFVTEADIARSFSPDFGSQTWPAPKPFPNNHKGAPGVPESAFKKEEEIKEAPKNLSKRHILGLSSRQRVPPVSGYETHSNYETSSDYEMASGDEDPNSTSANKITRGDINNPANHAPGSHTHQPSQSGYSRAFENATAHQNTEASELPMRPRQPPWERQQPPWERQQPPWERQQPPWERQQPPWERQQPQWGGQQPQWGGQQPYYNTGDQGRQ